MSSTEHGYVPYTHGCRCDICRKAKADYMRERRARARTQAQKHTERNPGARGARRVGASRYVAPIDSHGTRFGYEEHGCRCFDCTEARAQSNRERLARRRAEERAERAPEVARQLAADGVPQAQIAARLNLSRAKVAQIVRGAA